MQTEIFIIYDNYQWRHQFTPSWGFACIVRTVEKTILFDTGGDPFILLENMKKIQINPVEIDMVILSHLHEDHTGGISGLLEHNKKLTIYLPNSLSRLETIMRKNEGKIVLIKDWAKIAHKTIVVAKAGALSLILDRNDGLILVASRIPKIVLETIKAAKKMSGKEISLLVAGFCFFSTLNMKKIVESFAEIGVKNIAPCHCCEERCRSAFRRIYRQNYIPTGAGSVIKITDRSIISLPKNTFFY